MAGIEDVAKLAGVSTALVSRYLNGRTGVGPEKKKRIADAIEALHYRRNDIARALVQQKTGAFGVIIDSLCQPFYRELVRGFEVGGQQTGYSMIFCDCMSDLQTKLRYTNFLSHNRVDGLIIYGSFITDKVVVTELSRSGFPYILIENDIQELNCNKVLVDNRGGIRQIVHYFFNQGYRDIGMFCWGMGSYAGRERYRGYLEGMSECGLSVAQDRIYNYEDNGGEAGLTEQLERLAAGDNLPQAILFGADVLAFQAIKIFRQKGIRIPQDVALSGFDHDYYLSWGECMPRLVTVEQPLYEMGRTAVHILAESIESPQPPRTVLFPVQFVPGETG